jgi:hypothetical protein
MTRPYHPWHGFDKAVSRGHTSAMDKEEQPRVIPLGDGLAARSPFESSAEIEGLYRLEFRVVYEQPEGGRMGQFVVDQLTVKRRPDGPPVTSEGIRQIPLAVFLRLAVKSNLMHVGPTIREGNTSTWELTWASPLSERARGGGGPSEQDLQTVADIYQAAYVTGNPPTKTVMGRLELPRSTASRWIALARERGLLGPATSGKAGG